MDQFKKFAHPGGRVLMGLLFLIAGLGKLHMGVAEFGAYIDTKLPLGMLAPAVIVFEFVAGLMLILGYRTRMVALALAAFCIFSGVFYHQGMAEVTNLLKNLALAGGYLLLFVHGAGGYSIDKD